MGVLALAFVVASNARAVVHPPDINPANFSYPIVNPNPRFPLVPGTTFFYEGEKDGVPGSNAFAVTCDTRLIEGVVTTVVHDLVYAGDPAVLIEDTFDFFAQDNAGNVWYFGEDSTSFPSGSTEGSWEAGVDDADAGIIMLAAPRVGDRYYQEFAPRVAVDLAKVLSLKGTAFSPYTGTVGNLLVTKETSQLDPGAVENKFYKSGVGFIRGEDVKGGNEFTQLVNVTTGNCTP
ncbi:MAG TPA: hypothetical protein VIY96_04925 [Thermoanaerobaculia bacterium]